MSSIPYKIEKSRYDNWLRKYRHNPKYLPFPTKWALPANGSSHRRNTNLYQIAAMLPERAWRPAPGRINEFRYKAFTGYRTSDPTVYSDLTLILLELTPYLGVARRFIPDWLQPLCLPVGRVEDRWRRQVADQKRSSRACQVPPAIQEVGIYELFAAARFVADHAEDYKLRRQDSTLSLWWLLGVPTANLALATRLSEYEVRSQIAFWLRTASHPAIIERIRRSSIVQELKQKFPLQPTVGTKLAFIRSQPTTFNARTNRRIIARLLYDITEWSGGVSKPFAAETARRDAWFKEDRERALQYKATTLKLLAEAVPTMSAWLPPDLRPRLVNHIEDLKRYWGVVRGMPDLRPAIEAAKAQCTAV